MTMMNLTKARKVLLHVSARNRLYRAITTSNSLGGSGERPLSSLVTTTATSNKTEPIGIGIGIGNNDYRRNLFSRHQLPSSHRKPYFYTKKPAVTVRVFSTSTSENNNTNSSGKKHNNVKDLPVKILYASQGGTAQIFAMQLSEALEEVPGKPDVTIQGLNEDTPTNLLQPGEALYVFLASVTGVGEPPDNAREFYQWMMDLPSSDPVLKDLDYTVFGLGNQKAHPNHYNVIGKGIDAKLQELGANRIYELGLGDDGECLEDDFDNWMEGFLQKIYHGGDEKEPLDSTPEAVATSVQKQEAAQTTAAEDSNISAVDCVGARENGKRRVSSKYPRLKLQPSNTDVIREDMFRLQKTGEAFYQEGTESLPVLSNRPLNYNAGENGLYEMRISLKNHAESMKYETGDHLMVYPRNAQSMVEGYLQQLDVDPHVTIEEPEVQDAKHPYPHPTGITLAETLSHCVDLSAIPNPVFARLLLGRKEIDYKNEIAFPRRTILELLADAPRKLTLEEILFNLPPMRPRYYSIASSSVAHPEEIYLTYRPVQYTTTRGNLRMGVCTSYMANLLGKNAAEDGPAGKCSNIVAAINSNPTFRLPEDKKTPVLMVAGGCGIAPIRAFLEERIQYVNEAKHNPYGEGYLFLGFRSPADAPYKELIQQAFQCGAISSLHITYATGCGKGVNTRILGGNDIKEHSSCGMVSDAVGEHGEPLYSFFERGGHTFICGGARLFGVAIENKVHNILQEHGSLTEQDATKYLQGMLKEGRFNEDLSD